VSICELFLLFAGAVCPLQDVKNEKLNPKNNMNLDTVIPKLQPTATALCRWGLEFRQPKYTTKAQ
jgi:hypothetical protein